MAVEGRLEFIEREMCVRLLGKRILLPQVIAWADQKKMHSKRLEKQIQEMEMESEAKKMEVCLPTALVRYRWASSRLTL